MEWRVPLKGIWVSGLGFGVQRRVPLKGIQGLGLGFRKWGLG